MAGFESVRRGRAAAFAVAAAILGGALLAPTAEADDGIAPPVELTAPASEAVEAASEMLATVPVDIEVTEGETPAVVEDSHPPGGSTSEATAPADTTAPEPETGDTTAADSDTMADTGSEPMPAPVAATPPAASSRTSLSPSAPEAAAPTNVNISVRIDSAGDDGPVTQVNVSVAPSAAGEGTSGASAGTASGPAAPPSAADPGAGASEASVIDWIWSCLGLTAISPTVSTTESSGDHDTRARQPNQNCGNNASTFVRGVHQYQREIGGQYRPINVNVSIRLSSPGDNGPVSQTNVVIALGGGQQAPPFERPAPGGAAVVVDTEVSVVTSTFVASTTPFVAEAASVDVISPPVLDDATFEPELPRVYPRPASIVFSEPDAASRRRSGGLGWPTAVALPVLGVAGLHASRIAFGPEARSTETDAHANRSAPAGRPPPTGPPRANAPGKSIVLLGSAPGGASVAPASSGSSSSGGLPIFLLFPFLAVMLDLARRVVASCLTWPSGHRARMPETPG